MVIKSGLDFRPMLTKNMKETDHENVSATNPVIKFKLVRKLKPSNEFMS